MTLKISSVFTYDEDAGNYIQAVESADGQALEPATRKAINNFVLGCKADGIWSAIKASCILSGARTLAGALVPLAGTAPTNFNFVSGDYNRKTGLVGDGSTKYLNANFANNATPQNSVSASLYLSSPQTVNGRGLLDSGSSGPVNIYSSTVPGLGTRNRSTTFNNISFSSPFTGFIGTSRSNSANYVQRVLGANITLPVVSNAPDNGATVLFGFPGARANARLAFYSIGESLDLALLDARVTDLINAFGVTIP